ncbi:TauD/TfdA family dioxygenase [Pseudonocardia spinosispora]|uniref:TauD/TfdA family dioxygenase n=1 Tax=Pseudonocardia spinosispora TaxID=103441 RepID=UPI00040C5A4D|nr:TauD/TfdA family dioxygenase [Pseudonocardia spinosispora]
MTAEYSEVTNPLFVEHASALAGKLPTAVLHACRPPDPTLGLVVLRGLPVDEGELGPTPASWSAADHWCAAEQDILLFLLATVMGRVFGWAGQQDGRLVHDIVPARGSEREQTGASSSVLLTPHTEDAFHPRRANYLMLGCLRNPDRVGTTAASVRQTELNNADIAILSRADLPILPDSSYGEDHSGAGVPPPVATVWRKNDGLGLRYDPAYTPLARASPEYGAAYRRLGAELERVSHTIVLNPGEFLVLDNDAVVHGRVPFTARYDGTDRWIKRVNIRAARPERPDAEAREHGYGQEVVDPYA